MFNIRPRTRSTQSMDLLKKCRRLRSVQLKKDLSSDNLQKSYQKLDLNKVHYIEPSDRLCPKSLDDDINEIAIQKDLCRFKYESVEQILTKNQNAISIQATKITPSNNNREYFKCYKSFNRSQQLIEQMKLLPNMFQSMIDVSQDLNLIPKPLGLPRQASQNQSINVSGQLLGQQQYSKIVVGALKNQPAPVLLNLSENKLTAESIENILVGLKEGVQVIDLTNNKIGANFNFNFKIRSLQKLILASTELKDQSFRILLKRLPINLKVLDLSNNLLTDNCIQYLPVEIYLQELYMKWNRISGQGGYHLFQLLHNNTSIKVLDLSHNALGHPQKRCFESLQKFFVSSSSEIIHLDLSHNQFSQDDCQSIAESLQNNQQVIGFHLSGNQQWYIDPQGQARDKNQTTALVDEHRIQRFKGNQIDMDEINQQLRQMIAIQKLEDELNTINPTHVRTKINSIDFQGENILQNQKFDLFDNCWICDGWQEVKFEWIPQISGQIDREPIYLHVEFLEYKPILMDFYDKIFYIHVMCPPNKTIRYFFSDPTSALQLIAQNQQNLELAEDDLLRKRETFRPVFNYGHNIYFRSNQMISTNVIKTKRTNNRLFQGVPLFNKNSQFIFNSRPRKAIHDKNFINDLDAKKVWNSQQSIFKYFQGDSDLLLDQCFEFDYQRSRIQKFCDDQLQNDIVKETLRPHYQQIMTVYKYYASMSMNTNIPCIQINQFVEMVSKTNILKGMLLTDLQLLFISSCSKDLAATKVKREYLVDKSVVRHQFLELIVRLAIDKFGKKGLKTQDCITSLIYDEKLIDIFFQFDLPQQWRIKRYFNKECDEILTKCMPVIQQVYFYATTLTIKKHSHRTKLIGFKDFSDLINEAGVMLTGRNDREVMNIYIISIQSQVNEVNNIYHFMMNIFEFMESLARLAEYLSPCRDENKNQFLRRQQPLSPKLFVLIWILYHQLKSQIKPIYVRKGLPFIDYEACIFETLIRSNGQIKNFEKGQKDSLKNEQQIHNIIQSKNISQLNQIVSSQKDLKKIGNQKLLRVQSLDRNTKNTEQPTSNMLKTPIFKLSSLLGTDENRLPVVKTFLQFIHKQQKSQQKIQEQYQVMNCLKFF